MNETETRRELQAAEREIRLLEERLGEIEGEVEDLQHEATAVEDAIEEQNKIISASWITLRDINRCPDCNSANSEFVKESAGGDLWRCSNCGNYFELPPSGIERDPGHPDLN